MADLDLCFTPATELARRVRAAELSPVEIVENSLARIEQVNPVLNCFCFVYPDEALELARRAERAVSRGDTIGPLHGVPIAIKDLTPTRGKRTTMGSYAYEDHVPETSALLVEKLLGAGAIMVGKTTTPEFAYSSFTDSPLWGITRNPWDTGRTPGGSSGGSGAAVAAGCVPLAEGSDMGGSVRIPASWSGVVGLKPSFGRIPFDFLPTQLDTIQHLGPLARTVADARLFVDIGQGPDERDLMSLAPPLALSAAARLVGRGLAPGARRRPRPLRSGPGGRGGNTPGGRGARRGRGGRTRRSTLAGRERSRTLGSPTGVSTSRRSSVTFSRPTETGWILACSRSWTTAWQ